MVPKITGTTSVRQIFLPEKGRIASFRESCMQLYT